MVYDLLIVGGGVNGCGIARDAAGRGLSVCLLEMEDLGHATSSASTKLFHGGLRYLEYFEIRLVREALIERERLLRAMPHISWPMRFVLPTHPDMRFDTSTPTTKLLNAVFPWRRGQRPDWLIRLGLWLYDNLGGRKILPPTSRVDLDHGPEGEPLRDDFHTAFEYSDCWIEDSRLVALNARDAQGLGAKIRTREKMISAEVKDGIWQIQSQNEAGKTTKIKAKMVINAAGPWVEEVLSERLESRSDAGVRLVRGSHIVTKRLYDHDKAYFLQGPDGRIIFAIPYETDFTLIGTTDADHEAPSIRPECSTEERDYLIAFINRYLQTPISAKDIVWSYSGVRPLYDDGAKTATSATRDYVLKLDHSRGAPALNIFGGKITTYRKLAESALEHVAKQMPTGQPWTALAPLPGGDFGVHEVEILIANLLSRYPFLDKAWATRLIKAYGTDAVKILGKAKTPKGLGQDFGATLTEAEVKWLMKHEFAKTAEDVVWRRSKLGLRLSQAKIKALDTWMKERRK